MTGQNSQPPAAGFHGGSVSIRLPDDVHYTTNGRTPTAQDPTASEVQTFTETTVVRYAAFGPDGKQRTPGAGTTLFVNEPPTRLMTLSIGIDNWRLFDNAHGWFRPGHGADPNHWKQPGANWWTKAEHPVHCDLLEADGTPVFSGTLGLRMFGGMSRLHPQKSFSLSARERYGSKRIDHSIFGEAAGESFRFLVARNAGSDWNRSYLRDALLTDLLRDESWDLERQAARPVQVYLNGRYWGVYHLREKINPRFLKDRHPAIDKNNLDLLEHQQTVKHGNLREYRKLTDFIASADLTQAEPYRQLGELMDIDNFMRLQIAQTYFDNRDAGGNIRYWRPRTPDGRWRWILYDVDQGFGLHQAEAYKRNTLAFYTATDGPAWPNPPWSTLLQRRLLTNPAYRRQFANRSLDYLQTDFKPTTVRAAIERRVAGLTFDMPRQLARWRGKETHWQIHLQRLRDFADQRPTYLREHLRTFFAGGADREVTLTATPGGYVRLNDNLRIDEASYTGTYFARLPISVAAVPHPGFRFRGWEGLSGPAAQDVSLTQDRPLHAKAIFEPHDHPLADQVIINEYCPRSAASGDWIELHNRSPERVDLTGWRLVDSRHEFRLPSANIPPGDYLVICRDPERFRTVYPAAHNVIGGLPFGLNKTGERIGLYGPRGAYVNLVNLTSSSEDSSFVQALVLPGLDNTDPRNWSLVNGRGTPCTANPAHLQAAVITNQDYWLRIGIGIGVLILLGVIKQYR